MYLILLLLPLIVSLRPYSVVSRLRFSPDVRGGKDDRPHKNETPLNSSHYEKYHQLHILNSQLSTDKKILYINQNTTLRSNLNKNLHWQLD